jgi:hypothetical protein
VLRVLYPDITPDEAAVAVLPHGETTADGNQPAGART